jgi:predicted PurR-regulated permease PerM
MVGMAGETRDKFNSSDSRLITAILVMAVLYFAREVFVPLALAGLLAFLLAPAATRLERFKMRRALECPIFCAVG